MSCTALIIAACYTVLLLISNSVVRVIAEDAEDNIISKLGNKVPGFGSPIPTIGSNVEGKSVFTNFANFYDDGQVSNNAAAAAEGYRQNSSFGKLIT